MRALTSPGSRVSPKILPPHFLPSHQCGAARLTLRDLRRQAVPVHFAFLFFLLSSCRFLISFFSFSRSAFSFFLSSLTAGVDEHVDAEQDVSVQDDNDVPEEEPDLELDLELEPELDPGLEPEPEPELEPELELCECSTVTTWGAVGCGCMCCICSCEAAAAARMSASRFFCLARSAS